MHSDSTYQVASAGFEAARRLDRVPAGHPAGRLHGHSFRATVCAALPRGFGGFAGAEAGALRERLERCVAALDHRGLNEIVDDPGDEALARWIVARLDLPGAARIALRSAPLQGVEIDADGAAQAWRRYRFESAHRLPLVPPGHKCGRMHGHGFEVLIRAAAADADRIDAQWAPLQAELDHRCLNEIAGLENPTSENLAAWIRARLHGGLPGLSWVTVFETGSCGAHYDGDLHRIWKDCRFDSAVALRGAPAHDARARLHGHTYTLRLHLAAPLDALLGWTIDFGDVKRIFDPVFDALDHRPLAELAGLADGDAASIAAWVMARAQAQLPALVRVDVEETPGCGAVVVRGAAPGPLGVW
ncbi:MAG: 6-carboxytetrahydropterin synthase [Burkholderiales bacterium]|nr:6-carboxytetrahydropterin synthase [Burkholderiales bacterium]